MRLADCLCVIRSAELLSGTPKSLCQHRAQRSKLGHRASGLSGGGGKGLVLARTCGADSMSRAQSKSADAIAGNE